MKYVLLFVGTMDDQERFENMPAEEMAAGMKLAEQWFEEYGNAGKIVGGEQLKGPQTATTVRFQDGKPIVTDGPFIESKEHLGGFAVVDVADEEAARLWAGKIAVACGWPQEVRRFQVPMQLPETS